MMKAKGFLETRREPGYTEVLFSSRETGTDLIVFRGGPKEAREFRSMFTKELDAIIGLAKGGK